MSIMLYKVVKLCISSLPVCLGDGVIQSMPKIAYAVEWNNVTPGTIHAVLKKDRQSS